MANFLNTFKQRLTTRQTDKITNAKTQWRLSVVLLRVLWKPWHESEKAFLPLTTAMKQVNQAFNGLWINSHSVVSLCTAYKFEVTWLYECDVFVSTSAGWKFGQHKTSIRRSLIFLREGVYWSDYRISWWRLSKLMGINLSDILFRWRQHGSASPDINLIFNQIISTRPGNTVKAICIWRLQIRWKMLTSNNPSASIR